MLSIAYLFFFLACGFLMARFLLPRLRPLVRGYIGMSLGLLLMMWLPVLLAYAMAFTLAAHGVAAGVMALFTALAFFFRDKRTPAPFDDKEKQLLKTLLLLVVPMTLLSAYLQYTHSIRPAADGTYHVGQSTYGDLSLHLAITTSIVNAPFPLQNSLMLGATMAYPYLSDSFATSMYMMGQSLPMAMAFTGTVMMALVYAGYTLLCAQLCRRRGAAVLAVCLLFFNGGLGFFYTLGGTVENGVRTTVIDNLRNVMTGYYQTPTNQPDPNNLRWSNIICDMLVPQRGILGGWTMLLPCLNLLLPPLACKEKHDIRAIVLLGIMAGGMPLLHTHSFLALALLSGGVCLYILVAAKGERKKALAPWGLYIAITGALALPQLIGFTFVQATGSDHFLRFQFNWCNNRGGNGLVDPYLWFYIKNIGLPFLLILLALCQRRPKNLLESPEKPLEARDFIRQNRMIAAGAFTIFLVAEFILFQPNEYDNNKLFYVWFMLCLPMAADYAFLLYEKIKGIGGARALAGLVLITCFLSSGLTVARECVGDYEAYSKQDITVAEYVKEETPEHSVFLTGNQHLNPVSSLAGRTIVCSSDLYLYYHGFNTRERQAEVAAFYQDPGANLTLLQKYGVEYVYVSAYERNSGYLVNEAALETLFPVVYETANGSHRIFQVPEEFRKKGS